jgi:hypothetical protein
MKTWKPDFGQVERFATTPRQDSASAAGRLPGLCNALHLPESCLLFLNQMGCETPILTFS